MKNLHRDKSIVEFRNMQKNVKYFHNNKYYKTSTEQQFSNKIPT